MGFANVVSQHVGHGWFIVYNRDAVSLQSKHIIVLLQDSIGAKTTSNCGNSINLLVEPGGL